MGEGRRGTFVFVLGDVVFFLGSLMYFVFVVFFFIIIIIIIPKWLMKVPGHIPIVVGSFLELPKM